jgi:hypothetical protein
MAATPQQVGELGCAHNALCAGAVSGPRAAAAAAHKTGGMMHVRRPTVNGVPGSSCYAVVCVTGPLLPSPRGRKRDDIQLCSASTPVEPDGFQRCGRLADSMRLALHSLGLKKSEPRHLNFPAEHELGEWKACEDFAERSQRLHTALGRSGWPHRPTAWAGWVRRMAGSGAGGGGGGSGGGSEEEGGEEEGGEEEGGEAEG